MERSEAEAVYAQGREPVVEVLLALSEIPTVLLRLVGLPSLTVRAQATAEPRAP